jgi:Asp-tRNA(Asn)/Glu-tRNA(Gln) amidotransferase A subunit family amidase
MGSDTCGSIRIPASHNNLVGLRSTLGLASRAGIVPLSHTQDVGGPLARSALDLALLLDATVGSDPADPTTKLGEGRLARSFRDALRPDRLTGARIGVLKSLFGDAPEDEEVAAVVRKAIETMQKQGAETPEIAIPGLGELLRDSSVIDSEFKFDLAEYLGRAPDAPVRSLPEILERGLYDTALESALRRRAAVERPDSEAHRKALVKRRSTLAVILAALEEHRLTALAYPTIRRKAALVGEPQRGSNCQLSATTGLPALSLPAGFTDDGLPVGVELLGPPWSDAELLAIAHSFEATARLRRPPSRTPPLSSGKPPAAVAFEAVAAGLLGRFSFDATTGVLGYSVSARGIPADEILAATIHRGDAKQNGPAIARVLASRETAGSGSVTLSAKDQEELRAGRLCLRLYTRSEPLGSVRAQLVLP